MADRVASISPTAGRMGTLIPAPTRRGGVA